MRSRRTRGTFRFSLLFLLVPALPAWPQTPRPEKSGPGAFNQVEFRTTVLSARQAGTGAKKGEVVCELDAAPIKELLQEQATRVSAAEAAVEHAGMEVEAAELAVVAYREGTFRLEFEKVRGAVQLAKVELERAEDRMSWSKRMFRSGVLSLAEDISASLDFQRARLAHEVSQTNEQVLQNYTKDLDIKKGQSAVAGARAEFLRRQADLRREKREAAALERQVAACQVRAPADGVLEFAPLVEAGAVVRDGQLLFRVVPGGAGSR